MHSGAAAGSRNRHLESALASPAAGPWCTLGPTAPVCSARLTPTPCLLCTSLLSAGPQRRQVRPDALLAAGEAPAGWMSSRCRRAPRRRDHEAQRRRGLPGRRSAERHVTPHVLPTCSHFLPRLWPAPLHPPSRQLLLQLRGASSADVDEAVGEQEQLGYVGVSGLWLLGPRKWAKREMEGCRGGMPTCLPRCRAAGSPAARRGRTACAWPATAPPCHPAPSPPLVLPSLAGSDAVCAHQGAPAPRRRLPRLAAGAPWWRGRRAGGRPGRGGAPLQHAAGAEEAGGERLGETAGMASAQRQASSAGVWLGERASSAAPLQVLCEGLEINRTARLPVVPSGCMSSAAAAGDDNDDGAAAIAAAAGCATAQCVPCPSLRAPCGPPTPPQAEKVGTRAEQRAGGAADSDV